MRILVCVSEYPPGISSGIGHMTYSLVKEFEKKGHTCTICSPIGPDIKLGNEKLIQKTGGIGLLYFWSQVGRYFRNTPAEYDAVWLHWPLFITKSPFPKAVATFHGSYRGFRSLKGSTKRPLPLRAFYFLMQKLEVFCLSHLGESITFTVVGPQIGRELKGQGAKNSILYIPSGVDTELFSYTGGRDLESLVFAYVGRLAPPKNLFQLIDTFSEIRKIIVGARLKLVGDGYLRGSIEEYIERKGIPGVEFSGYISNKDLPYILSRSDFFMLASKYEGQPVALIEGMAMGLPPIVNDISALRFLVEESKTGIVVDFSKPVEASKRIVQYVTSPQASVDKVRVAEYVEDNMSLGICVDKYLEVLRNAR